MAIGTASLVVRLKGIDVVGLQQIAEWFRHAAGQPLRERALERGRDAADLIQIKPAAAGLSQRLSIRPRDADSQGTPGSRRTSS